MDDSSASTFHNEKIKITGQKVPGEDYKQEDSKKAAALKRMRLIAKIITANLVVVASLIAATWQLMLGAVTIYFYWQWFVVNAFPDLPGINFLQAIVIKLMTYATTNIPVQDIWKSEYRVKFFDNKKITLSRIAAPIFRLVMGWIIYKLLF